MVEGRRHAETLAAEIKAGGHALLSDVTAKNGGNDQGANPHQLLEAALAACTVITVQMYANRKAWPLKSTNVTVRIEAEGQESRIAREISFEGELSAEQRQRLLEIADKCPVHNLLESKITVSTTSF